MKIPVPAIPATPVAAASKFAIATDLSMPTSRGGFAKNSTPDEYPWDQLVIGASFLVPVEVPASITDETERAAAFKEAARKVANSLSGKIRNRKAAIEKAGGEAVNYGARTVNDDKLGKGVRVWRTEPETKAAAPAVPPVPGAQTPTA